MFTVESFPKVRKHTLSFLRYSKTIAPVTLSTEIDMTNVIAFKADSSHKLSYVTFLIYVISRVLKKNPHGHAVYKQGWSPKLVKYQDIHAKVTFSKILNDHFTVISTAIMKSNELSLLEIQDKINFYKNSPVRNYHSYHGLKLLHTLPQWMANLLFKFMMQIPSKAASLQGSFTISSLGHEPIDTFIPLSGNTMTFGVGQVKQRAIVLNGELLSKPTLILYMVFDHRAIDGFLSAKILSDIKESLENFKQ